MTWMTLTEWGARLILILLIFLSVWSLKIILERRRFFLQLSLPNPSCKNAWRLGNFTESSNHIFSDLIAMFSQFQDKKLIEPAFAAYLNELKVQLEKDQGILGTLGSTTPFIGLLGTVLGIVVSFGELSQGIANTNSVMFSLAEALILTAAGLIVAIPAVIAFNYFARKTRTILNEATILKDWYLAAGGQASTPRKGL